MIDYDRIEALCSLRLEGEQRERILKDLKEIIAYFEMLKEVDTDNVEPLVYTKGVKLFLRKDEPCECLPKNSLERNRKLFGDGFFRVRRIIGEQNEP